MLATLFALINMSGIPTASNSFINYFGFSSGSWILSLAFVVIFGMITAAAVTGIGATLFGRNISESYIISGTLAISTALLSFCIVDLYSVYIYLKTFTEVDFIANILGLFFFAITVGYGYAIIAYWRGNDI